VAARPVLWEAATEERKEAVSKGTPHRTVRIEDTLWNAAKAKAEAENDNLSEVIRLALVEYIKEGNA